MTPTKILSLFLSFCLILEQGVFAQTIDLSHYFARNTAQTIPQSDKFRPLHLRYISYDNQAKDFKILLDKGDFFNQKTEKPKNEKTSESLNSPASKLLSSETPELEKATQELMKYFFIGLSLPNEKFWVNLRPDSPDNILDPDLEKTDIGRIFLEADLQLKKDTSGMTSPQTKEGKEYWDKLYKKAGELFPAAGGSAFGGENITIPTLTRPWIVPDEVIIRESPEGAYIYKATLKVMLEEDYLTSRGDSRTAPTSGQYAFNDPRLKDLNEYSTQLIKESIIPKLTKEMNSARRYAPLRQVYYSLILAQWFKQKYGSSGSNRASGISAPVSNYIDLIDSGNLANLASIQSYDKQTYFQQYQKSFQDGEYNLTEPVYTPYGQNIRRYMSGGVTMPIGEVVQKITGSSSPMLSLRPADHNYILPVKTDTGMGVTFNSISASSTLEGNKNELPKSAVDLASYFVLKYPQENNSNELIYYFGGSLAAMLLSQADEVEILKQDSQSISMRKKIPISPVAKKLLEEFARPISDVDYFYYPDRRSENNPKDFKMPFAELPPGAKKAVKGQTFHCEGDDIEGSGNPAKVSINGKQFYVVEPLEMLYHLAHTFLYDETSISEKRAMDLNYLVGAVEELYSREVIVKTFHDRWFHKQWKNLTTPHAIKLLNSEVVELFDAIARLDNGEYIERLFPRPSWDDALRINGILEIVKSSASKAKIINFFNKNYSVLPLHSKSYVGTILSCLDENNIDVRLAVMNRLLSYSPQEVNHLLEIFSWGRGKDTTSRRKYEEAELTYFLLINAMNQLSKEEFKSLLAELNVDAEQTEYNGKAYILKRFFDIWPHVELLNRISQKYSLEIPEKVDREKIFKMAVSMMTEEADDSSDSTAGPGMASSAAEDTEASSSLLDKKGGIDLSRINKSIRTESMSSPGAGGLSSPVDVDFDVNEELIQLQNMLNAEIIPSASRLERYARAAFASPASSSGLADSALSLVAETFRLQEEKAAPTPAELKTLAAWLEDAE